MSNVAKAYRLIKEISEAIKVAEEKRLSTTLKADAMSVSELTDIVDCFGSKKARVTIIYSRDSGADIHVAPILDRDEIFGPNTVKKSPLEQECDLRCHISAEQKEALDAKAKALKDFYDQNELNTALQCFELCLVEVLKGKEFARLSFAVKATSIKKSIDKWLVENADKYPGYKEIYDVFVSFDTASKNTIVTIENIANYDKDGIPKNIARAWFKFFDTGLMAFLNTFLLMFGWGIVMRQRGKDCIVFPRRFAFKGYEADTMKKAYSKLRKWMADQSDTFEHMSH